MRIGLLEDERKHVGGIGGGIVLADRRPLPADLYRGALNRLTDYRTRAFCEGRMFYQREFDKWVIGFYPVAKQLVRERKDDLGVNVARHHECRIIWHVIAGLYEPHLVGC